MPMHVTVDQARHQGAVGGVDGAGAFRRSKAGRADFPDGVVLDQDIDGIGPLRRDVERETIADGDKGVGHHKLRPLVADQGKNTRSTSTTAWNSTMPMTESRTTAPKASEVRKKAVEDVTR